MKKTEILFILDRSTSMSSIAGSAVEGFNAFLKQQQKKSKGKRLTLLQFDDKLEFIYRSEKIKNCKPLVLGQTYVIQGCTALLDAIGTGLHQIRKAEKAIVAIYTDGQENMSKEFSVKKVKAALAKAELKGYEVIFLAADIDTTYATQTLGISITKVAKVDKRDFLSTMHTLDSYTTNYAKSGQVSATVLQADIDTDVDENSIDNLIKTKTTTENRATT